MAAPDAEPYSLFFDPAADPAWRDILHHNSLPENAFCTIRLLCKPARDMVTRIKDRVEIRFGGPAQGHALGLLHHLQPLVEVVVGCRGGDPQLDLAPLMQTLAGLAGLQHVTINSFSLDQISLSPCSSLPQLLSLKLLGFPSVQSLQSITHLTGLSELQLAGFRSLQSLEFLSSLSNLQDLACTYFTSAPPPVFTSNTALTSLNMYSYTPGFNLSSLLCLTNLRSLDLSRVFHADVDISVLSSLHSLTELYVQHTRHLQLTGVQAVMKLPNLQRLNLSFTPLFRLSIGPRMRGFRN